MAIPDRQSVKDFVQFNLNDYKSLLVLEFN